MLISDIALAAAEMAGDAALVAALGNAADNGAEVGLMLTSVHSALKRVADDFPLLHKKTVTAENGVIPYSAIEDSRSVTVRKAMSSGAATSFFCDSSGVHVKRDGSYDVVYNLAPSFDGTTADCTDADTYTVACLAARNYCLFKGHTDEASYFGELYEEIAQSHRLRRRSYLPKPDGM